MRCTNIPTNITREILLKEKITCNDKNNPPQFVLTNNAVIKTVILKNYIFFIALSLLLVGCNKDDAGPIHNTAYEKTKIDEDIRAIIKTQNLTGDLDAPV
jgi:hypothetical protein